MNIGSLFFGVYFGWLRSQGKAGTASLSPIVFLLFMEFPIVIVVLFSEFLLKSYSSVGIDH